LAAFTAQPQEDPDLTIKCDGGAMLGPATFSISAVSPFGGKMKSVVMADEMRGREFHVVGIRFLTTSSILALAHTKRARLSAPPVAS